MSEDVVPLPRKRGRRRVTTRRATGVMPRPSSASSELAVAAMIRDHVTRGVLEDVLEERRRQYARYGTNADLEDGTGPDTRWLGPFTGSSATVIESELRRDYEDFEEETGKPTWVHLIREEMAEAFAEADPTRLDEELVQVAALAVSWLEKIRARKGVARWPDGE